MKSARATQADIRYAALGRREVASKTRSTDSWHGRVPWLEQEKRAVESRAVPGFAMSMLFVGGIAGLVFAFVHVQALGILAAVLAFGIVVGVCFK